MKIKALYQCVVRQYQWRRQLLLCCVCMAILLPAVPNNVQEPVNLLVRDPRLVQCCRLVPVVSGRNVSNSLHREEDGTMSAKVG